MLFIGLFLGIWIVIGWNEYAADQKPEGFAAWFKGGPFWWFLLAYREASKLAAKIE